MADIKTAPSQRGAASSAPAEDTLSLLDVEWLPGGVFIADTDGRIAAVNQLLERLCGYTREELIGQPVELILPEALRPSSSETRAAFIAAPDARQVAAGRSLLARRRDGSQFPVEITSRPVQSGGSTFIVAAVADITARQESEEARNLAIEGRIQFEKLVAELSVKFINLPTDHVRPAIEVALRRIGEELELDRCSLYRLRGDGTAFDPISWRRPGVPDAPASVSGAEAFPWILGRLRDGQVVCFSGVDELPDPDRETARSFGVRSSVTVPLSVAGQSVGAVAFHVLREERQWEPDVVHRLTVIAAAFGNVLARQDSEEALRKRIAEVQNVRDRLDAENAYLRREAQERLRSHGVVGKSEAVQRVLEQVRQVAGTDSTVLLMGETGTGKELFATEIHELSGRRGRPMVRVNCAAIPATLIESELFGREKGAFTGALARQAGRFELADHSTIFLDEIGDLPLDVQVKLLRVIEERQIERLGSPRSIHVDTRIVAATHRNLEQRISNGTFREDLFYRLNVFPIVVPPLRERVEDIPLLVWRFVEEFASAFGKRIDEIPKDNMLALQRYAWPGNIRELRNIVERAMIGATQPCLTVTVPATNSAGAKKVSSTLADVEREHIRMVLEMCGWRIRGVGGAAERLGLRPTTLETRMAKMGLTRPKS
jgi:PAS domain S-box-containing protein